MSLNKSSSNLFAVVRNAGTNQSYLQLRRQKSISDKVETAININREQVIQMAENRDVLNKKINEKGYRMVLGRVSLSTREYREKNYMTLIQEVERRNGGGSNYERRIQLKAEELKDVLNFCNDSLTLFKISETATPPCNRHHIRYSIEGFPEDFFFTYNSALMFALSHLKKDSHISENSVFTPESWMNRTTLIATFLGLKQLYPQLPDVQLDVLLNIMDFELLSEADAETIPETKFKLCYEYLIKEFI